MSTMADLSLAHMTGVTEYKESTDRMLNEKTGELDKLIDTELTRYQPIGMVC